MAGEQIEIVIDANGLARTEQVFKSVDKYLERIHRRVDKLGRMRVTPMVRLNDRVTPQLEKINRALNRMTGQLRRVTIVPVINYTALGMVSVKLKTALKAALTLKAALDFKAALNLTATLDVKAALKAALSLKATLKAALNLKASFKLKASLTVFVKGIFKGKCVPCLPGKCKPGKAIKDKGRGGLQRERCKPDKDKKKRNQRDRDPGKKGPLKQKDVPKGGDRLSKSSKPPKIKPPKLLKVGKFKVPLPKMPKFSIPKLSSARGMLGKVTDGAKSLMGSKAGKSIGRIGKVAGKAFKPLGFVTDAMSIFGAKPGKERNKAIRSTVGGWGGAAAGAAAGAAIGSVVPILGTAVGGLIGGAIGGLGGSAIAENIGSIGKKIGNVGKEIGGWFGFGKKKKKKEEDPVALPAPAIPSQAQGPSMPMAPAFAASSAINVSLPSGAIQLTIQGTELNYDEISTIIGNKVATSIQQAMENRA
ncbi:hypothetical protein [Cohnella sp. WQ 127256]|uniref:hypothetical protein n=1 Tax=Cohnella sp. WQ 127256 TaxID=2938790 RepID=UPI002118097A|nr:hypothetical protein [Cohnella sp. WQ 127256]